MAVSVINSRQLHDKISRGESFLILDVRNPEDFQDWKIEAKDQEIVNIPYFDFLEEDEELYDQIPNDAEIIVVCAKEGSSRMVAEMLDGRGYRASVLEGGMQGWSQFYHPTVVADEDDFKLIQVNRPAKGCLSYMVISQGKALVVDPNRHVDEYLRLAEREHAAIEHVIDTHLHADHISGGRELADKTGATYYISSSEMHDSRIPYEPLENHPEVSFGSVNVKVIAVATPGHTPGSVSILVNGRYLLSGDTIFVGGLGRPDLGGKAKEWAQLLYETVFQTIAALPDDVIVLPSHYADIQEINDAGYVGAPLGDIRQNNEIMRTEDRERFTETVSAGAGTATPPNFEEIVEINRGAVKVTSDKAVELEIGPNRCAIHHSH